jgi:Domain of unknown function (DUF4149)
MGSIFFFAAVVAPTSFSVLPSRALAGMVVSRSLFSLHWIAIICALVFLLSSVLEALWEGYSAPFHLRDLLLLAMMSITLFAHFGIERRMNTLRNDMGVIDVLPHEDARRIEFNRLHVWSTRLEGSVFFCGLALLFLVAREQTESQRGYYRS